MKLVVVAALLALSFTTGFTCSKNTPVETAPAPTPAAQEQMAAPAEGQPAATATPAGEAPAATPGSETK
ncbi:MAG TPA: acylneuraminate cytidylyltransferase [Pseudobdellovibrionaceae bacterium]|jgi:hypothetical protein